MPNRILREGVLSSERVNALPAAAELFYRRLMSVVDDFGRIELQPQILRARCYPLQLDRVSVDDVKAWLDQCSAGGDPLVTVYAVSGKTYLQINNFGQRERASKCPSPQDADKRGQMRADDGGLRSDDGELPQSAAYARATTPTPTTPPRSQGGSAEGGISDGSTAAADLIPMVSVESFNLFESLLGLFIALGRGIGIGDRMVCENHWRALSERERQRAHDYAMAQRPEWQLRPTGKIPQAWNFLKEKHWERDSPRLLAQVRPASKAEEAHDVAKRRFLGGQA